MIDPLKRWAAFGEKPDYAGPLSYGGAPYTQDQSDLEGADVAIVGAPMDELVSDRPGTRFAPRAIRAASCPPGPNLETAVDALDELRVVDYGDAPILPADPVRSHAAIEETVGQVLAAGAHPRHPGRGPLHHRAGPARLRRRQRRPHRPGALRHPHRHRRRSFRRRALARHDHAPARRGGKRRSATLRPDRTARLLAWRQGVRLAERARYHEPLHARGKGPRHQGGHGTGRRSGRRGSGLPHRGHRRA